MKFTEGFKLSLEKYMDYKNSIDLVSFPFKSELVI